MSAEAQPSGWGLWRRQAAALFRMELRKVLFSRRSFAIYILALLPIVPFAGRAAFLLLVPAATTTTTTTVTAPDENGVPQERVERTVERKPHYGSPEEGRNDATIVYANLFQIMFLPLTLFLGCVWTFMNLFRGDILDRVLHFYVLAPLRREVLVAGKYAAGVAGMTLVYGASAAVSFWLAYLPFGDVFGQGRGGQLLAYLGITLLACIGYGGLFLLFGLLLRNPVVPAILIWGWEGINFLLPAWLKKFSVIHYLRSLTPVPVSEGPLAIIAEPTPAYLAVPGLLILTAILVYLAARRVRRLEIRYSSD